MIKHIISLIRVKHWVKNSFLFIPIFFSGDFFNQDKLILLLLGALSFSLVASAIYVLNDFMDISIDKKHPVKKYRPLASGEVSKQIAIVLMFTLLALGIGSSIFINTSFTFLLVTYFVLNLAYSLKLKQIAILDLFIVSSGFIIRIFSGGLIADIPLSQWLVIMILLLSLLMVLGKRRDDLILFQSNKVPLRKASQTYNLEYINACLTMLSGITIVAYLMYTLSEEVVGRLTDNLYLTTVFVIAGIMRYLQIVLVHNESGSPTKILLRDKFIITTLLLWIVSFYFIIYSKYL
jgi:4-hydroxybenzoate polyprenyltransferase